MTKPQLRVETTPERVGRYDILARIASGGMATVYLARARGVAGLERNVALKVTHPHVRESVDFARTLVDEAKIAVRIRHANVVPVLDVGDDPTGLFLVMEYVEGDTFSGLLRRAIAAGAPLAPEIGARILLDALAGLHAAHEVKDDAGNPVGLVHRDFSPQNILVGTDGISRLTDFGIAKAAARLDETRAGVVKGKIRYMAPEQARGQAIDRRCDVWAAGVIAWELFAGRRLYDGSEEDVGLIFRIATETPPPLSAVRPEIGAALVGVVARALAPDRDVRYATASELAKDLARALGASGVVPADASEVAEHVERAVGTRLAERRRRALARSFGDGSPTGEGDAVSDEISLRTLGTPSDAARSGEVLRSRREPATDPAPPPEEDPWVPPRRGPVAWFSQPAGEAGKRTVALVVVAAVALGGLVVALVALASRGSSVPATVASSPAAPSEGMSAPAAEVAAPPAEVAAPPSASAAELPASSAEVPAPSTDSPAPRTDSPAPRADSPAPRADSPRPAAAPPTSAPRPATPHKTPPPAPAPTKTPNLDRPF